METHNQWVQEKLRKGAIQVRKVRGNAKPADLFTKHLPSSIKIGQLVKLFWCECRECGSLTAPMLRPLAFQGTAAREVSATALRALAGLFDTVIDLGDLNSPLASSRVTK